MTYLKGDIIYLKDYSMLAQGKNIQNGVRPMLVVSNNKNNKCSNVLLAVPCTTKLKRLDLPSHVLIGVWGMAITEQIFPVTKDNINKVKGRIDNMSEVDEALKEVLCL